MAQTLGRFDTPIRDGQGRLFEARVCGREARDQLWEGWIEFENQQTGEILRTSREPTQPNLTDLRYWARGLTEIYLEGGVERITHEVPHLTPRATPPPAFDDPAAGDSAGSNPFSVYEKSPALLAQELTALRGWHLRQIIRDYHLERDGDQPIADLTERELGGYILRRVRELRA